MTSGPPACQSHTSSDLTSGQRATSPGTSRPRDAARDQAVRPCAAGVAASWTNYARLAVQRARDGGAEHGDEQGEQRYPHDGDGDQANARGADDGQPAGRRTDSRQLAEAPDQRDDREDDQAGDHVVLEHDTAEGGEGYRCPRPGQRRALERQAGVAFLDIARHGFARLWVALPGVARIGAGHRSAEISRTIAEMIAIP